MSVSPLKPKILFEDLAPTVVPNSTPEVAVREYFLSKFEERLIKRKPEWDWPPLSPATELVAARRDLQEANKELKEKWTEGKVRRQDMDTQWEGLRQQEENLKKSFIHFNEFVKENKEKRERAEKKIQEEKEVQERRDGDIFELNEKVKNLTEIKESLESHVNKYKMYEDYLKSVVADTKEFSTVFDILNRYETLNSARTELSERQKKDLVTLENAHSEVVKITEEKSQVMLGLNNQLADLQSRYDKAKAESLRWETALSNIKNTAAEKALELDQVKMSCWNMYQQICRRKNVPLKYEEGEVEQQLVYIKRTVQELKKIVRIARRRASRETASTVATPTDNPK